MHVCLDLGNVLFHLNFNEFKEKFSSLCPANYFFRDMESFIDCGMVDLSGALRLYSPANCSEINNFYRNQLDDAWSNVITPDEEMIGWVKRLLSHEVKIAILSNIGLDHSAHVRKIIPSIIENCETWFSCNVGARKPSKLYFQTFLERHPEFNGAVYLDDKKDNCVRGREYGLQSINFVLEDFKKKTPKERLEELEDLSNLIMA